MRTTPDELVIALTGGISKRKLYFADHPKVHACCQNFARKLASYLAESERQSVFIGVADSKLIFEGKFLIGPTIVGRKLVGFAESLRCGGFEFGNLATIDEIRELFGLAASLTEPTMHLAASRQLLESRGIRNITISPPYRDPEWFGQGDLGQGSAWEGETTSEGCSESLVMIYQALFDSVESAHGLASIDGALDIDGTRRVSGHLLRSIRGDFMDIMQLVDYPDHDTYTLGHSVRVALLAVMVGYGLNMSQEYLMELGTAALLHDVGKSRIPDEILFKPGRLDPEERGIIETHARLGAEILLEHEKASPLAIGAAWGHHIRHDRGGYPQTPAWAVRNDVTAVLQVCDVFEALTAIRPYKAPLTPRRAFEIMLADEGAFHPGAFGAFIKVMGLYPPGSQVLLSDGSRAVVVAAGHLLDKPVVRLTHDAAGDALQGENRRSLDLASASADGLCVTTCLTEDATGSQG